MGMIQKDQSLQAQYEFLRESALKASQELFPSQTKNAQISNSIFSVLCVLCYFPGNSEKMDDILSLLKMSENPNSLDYEEILEYIYDLTSLCEKSSVNTSDLGNFQKAILSEGMAQLGSSSLDEAEYYSFLLNTLETYHRKFLQQASSSLSGKSLRKKKSFKRKTLGKKLFWIVVTLLLLLMIACVFGLFCAKSLCRSSVVPFSAEKKFFSLPDFPSGAPALSSYEKYYRETQSAISEQTQEWVHEKYLERQQNASLSVYIQADDTCYHCSSECSKLDESEAIISCTLEDAMQSGHPYPCSECCR